MDFGHAIGRAQVLVADHGHYEIGAGEAADEGRDQLSGPDTVAVSDGNDAVLLESRIETLDGLRADLSLGSLISPCIGDEDLSGFFACGERPWVDVDLE